jgi:transposase InsO family protein
MMPVVDEYSRECLSIDVGRSITAEDVVETLSSLFRRRGEPVFIRSDRAGLSSSLKPSSSGWKSLGLGPYKSSLALRGRTLTQRRSSVALGTSC